MFNKYIVHCLSILLSSFFHKSAIIFLFYSYIKGFLFRFQNRSIYVVMALCSFLLSVFIGGFFNDFLNHFIFFSSKISMYYVDTDSGLFSGFGGKQILIIVFLFYFIVSKVSKELPNINIQCFNISYISFCFFITFSSSPSISYRVFEIFEIFFIISLCSVVKVRPRLGLCFCFVYIFLSIRAVFFIDNPLIKVLT
ncbi:EpsG family protein [Vibrio lentus]